MKPAAASSTVLDASAISVSGLCLIHCLALPLLSVILPMAGTLGESELLHRIFVLMAVPITATAIVQDRASGGGSVFAAVAVIALSILLAAAFVERLHDAETVLTTVGASLLALAHVYRWQRRYQA